MIRRHWMMGMMVGALGWIGAVSVWAEEGRPLSQLKYDGPKGVSPFDTPEELWNAPDEVVDPKKSATQKIVFPECVIQGLVWAGPRPAAIINGRVYGVGDKTAEGVRVKSITREGVELVYADQIKKVRPVPGAARPKRKIRAR